MDINAVLELFKGLAPEVLLPALLILTIIAALRWIGLLSEGAFTQVVVILSGVASTGTFYAGASFEEVFVGLLTAFIAAVGHRLLTVWLPALSGLLVKAKKPKQTQ